MIELTIGLTGMRLEAVVKELVFFFFLPIDVDFPFGLNERKYSAALGGIQVTLHLASLDLQHADRICELVLFPHKTPSCFVLFFLLNAPANISLFTRPSDTEQ